MLVHILQNVSDGIPQLKVPCNVGTISKQLKLDFPFEQHVCCPTCYSLYDVEVAPGDCIYKPTATGTPCGTEIFRQQKINPLGDISFTSYNSTPQNQSRRSGQIRLQGQPHLRIPHASFFSQSVLSWLEWFLNVPGIDDWACELSSHKSTIVSDVAQGTVWRSLFPSRSPSNQSLELGFNLFVDWFNPRGNKILGKQVSMGILALHCLNLQPRERFQQQNTCLAGVIPAPNQPDMMTMNNVLKPLVEELIELNNGKNINTPGHPHGRKVIVKLVCLIGDIVATHKLSRWGPLNGISEYGGERLVGILQKLKTNTLNGCSEQTIMKKFGQLQRLHKVDPQLHLAPSKNYTTSAL
ncbi:hypothetical protein O181_111287 [Austropuccinia psidii MF-1]|uniref:Uncharacterized protein n=1 Tax=Austropuccinia psidii MF-1 TaxID=1389203 RepID=A0A9Q3JZM8_9BASI|nr:hypothetical protein [Austropuccinia psidii MF-1]